jgi:hypothetical protein
MDLDKVVREINKTRGPVGSHRLLTEKGVYALFLKVGTTDLLSSITIGHSL